MELKHITAFIATYEEGSINRAAQRLGNSQPSISVLIRDLETELCTALFERQARGAEPTEQAKTLYPHFQRMLAELHGARMSLAGRLNQMAGPLHAGLGPTITRGILPDILSDFLEAYPRVDVRITEAFSGKLIEWTLSGELDFAVIAIPPQDRRVIARRICVDPIVLISGPSSKRQHLRPCRLADETDLKLVLPWSKYSIRGMLDAFIQAGQIPTKRVVEMDSLSAMLDFVQTSDWVTFLPMTAVSRQVDNGRFILQPVTDPPMSCEFYLIHPARRTLSAAAKLFAELVETGFQEAATRWSHVLAQEKD